MASVRATVASPVGLYARPAAIFVRAGIESGLAVVIAKVPDAEERPPTDARSILGVLALDVVQGDDVPLSADGPAAVEVLGELAAWLTAGEGEFRHPS